MGKRRVDQPDDNIYIWDLYSLQTEGGLYFKDEYAVSEKDSHLMVSLREGLSNYYLVE